MSKPGVPTQREVAGHLFLRDQAAPVYEGETEAEALTRAVEEIPAFRERAAYLQQQEATGYPNAIPEDEVDRFLAALRSKEGRPSGRRARGDSGNVRVRMPRKLHKELAAQADREGVSLNTLIVTYLAREAGVRSVLAERL